MEKLYTRTANYNFNISEFGGFIIRIVCLYKDMNNIKIRFALAKTSFLIKRRGVVNINITVYLIYALCSYKTSKHNLEYRGP